MRLLLAGGFPYLTTCCLPRFSGRVGTIVGLYLVDISFEAATWSRVFVASAASTSETGNGLSCRPSPAERHKQAMMTTMMIWRPKQDLFLYSLVSIEIAVIEEWLCAKIKQLHCVSIGR